MRSDASLPVWSQVNLYSPNQPTARARPALEGLSSPARAMCWPASPDLAPYIGGFYLYTSNGGAETLNRAAFLPGDAHLLFFSGANCWRVRPARCDWIEPGPVSLFGPSSALVLSEATAFTLVGAAIRPLGWLRLLSQSAKNWANRIDEAPSLGETDLKAFYNDLFEFENEEIIPTALDRMFRAALHPAPVEEEAVWRIEAALLNPPWATVGELAGAADMSIRSLERLANRAFGFGPKLLMRRARFLRSLQAIQEVGPGERSKVIDSAYTDYSHFVRDSHDFLGMAPQGFLRMNLPPLRYRPRPGAIS